MNKSLWHINQMTPIKPLRAFEHGMGAEEKKIRRAEKTRLAAKAQRIEEQKAEGTYKLTRIERDQIWLQEQRNYIMGV